MLLRLIHLPAALAALALPMGAETGNPGGETVFSGQITIHERVIIRVPRMRAPETRSRMPVPMPPRWKEKHGPRCVTATDLAGAMISQPGSVDLVLHGGGRLRALLDDDCGPLDYYGGFYLRPAADGKICGNRDMIRVRSGGGCAIARFKRLVPAR